MACTSKKPADHINDEGPTIDDTTLELRDDDDDDDLASEPETLVDADKIITHTGGYHPAVMVKHSSDAFTIVPTVNGYLPPGLTSNDLYNPPPLPPRDLKEPLLPEKVAWVSPSSLKTPRSVPTWTSPSLTLAPGHSLKDQDLDMDPEHKDWYNWKINAFEQISGFGLAGESFGRPICGAVLCRMLESGVEMYYDIMVRALKSADLDDREKIFDIRKAFSTSFLDIAVYKHAKPIFEAAKEAKIIGPGRVHVPSEEAIQKLFTRQTDIDAWRRLLNNMQTHNPRATISRYFHVLLDLTLANTAIMSVNFLLAYYHYVMDIVDLIMEQQANNMYIIESVVMRDMLKVIPDLVSPAYTIEKKIREEIKINVNNEESQKSPPLPSSSSSDSGSSCQMQ